MRSESREDFHPPVTAMRGAMAFYLNAGKHLFILDAPFRDEQKQRISLGSCVSKLLVASLPQFAEARESADIGAEELERLVVEFRTTLEKVVDFAAKRAGIKLLAEKRRELQTVYLSQITTDRMFQALKEAPARAKANRQYDERRQEAGNSAERAESDGPSHDPPPPDDFARLQRAASELIFESLVSPDGKTLDEFLKDLSGGTFTRIVPTGLWRDRTVSDALVASDETLNIAPKRNLVESFLIRLPNIARRAVESDTSLSPEQKLRARTAAQILYRRASDLRAERQNVVDPRTQAADTARLNAVYARVYGTLYKNRILPALSTPLDIEDRRPNESDAAYQRRVRESVRDRDKSTRKEASEFNAARKEHIVRDLLAFMDRLEADEDIGRIFPGTLGSVLASTGKQGRAIYKRILDEVNLLPIHERFDRPRDPELSTEGHPSYVVSAPGEDAKRHILRQPPEAARARLDSASASLREVVEAIRVADASLIELSYEALSPATTDSIVLAKKLDVIEAGLGTQLQWSRMYDAQKAIGSREDPSTLWWKATRGIAGELSAAKAAMNDVTNRLRETRRIVLLKLIVQAKQEITQSGAPEQYSDLSAHLATFEALARNPKAQDERLREYIAFFMSV